MQGFCSWRYLSEETGKPHTTEQNPEKECTLYTLSVDPLLEEPVLEHHRNETFAVLVSFCLNSGHQNSGALRQGPLRWSWSSEGSQQKDSETAQGAATPSMPTRCALQDVGLERHLAQKVVVGAVAGVGKAAAELLTTLITCDHEHRHDVFFGSRAPMHSAFRLCRSPCKGWRFGVTLPAA